VRGILEAGESLLTEAKKDITLECARELDVDEDAKLQPVLVSNAMEGGNDPSCACCILYVYKNCILFSAG
jgi:hypothetical protein